MAVDIEYIPHETEIVHEIVGEPGEDDEVISSVSEEDAYGNVHTLYKVEREITISKEEYIVYTSGARGSKSWTYSVRQNDEGEWEVIAKHMSHGRTNRTVRQSPESTEAVRKALKEQFGIEVAN